MSHEVRVYSDEFVQKSMADLPELMNIDQCIDKNRDEKEELADNQFCKKIDALMEQNQYMTHMRAMDLLSEFPMERALRKARREPNPARKPLDEDHIKHLGFPEESQKRARKRTLKAQEAFDNEEKENAPPPSKKAEKRN